MLTSAYLLAFAVAQLPLGVALDRYGPRKVQVPMMVLAAVGAALFAMADSLPTLVAARALIGLGVAGSLTDLLGRRGYRPLLVCGAGVWCFVLFQLLMFGGSGVSPIIIAMGFSFFGTSTTMNYAIVAQSVPPHLTGRVSTSFNLIVFLLAFALQWGIGGVINLWAPNGGAYPVAAYQCALWILLARQIPGLLLWLTFKPWQKVR